MQHDPGSTKWRNLTNEQKQELVKEALDKRMKNLEGKLDAIIAMAKNKANQITADYEFHEEDNQDSFAIAEINLIGQIINALAILEASDNIEHVAKEVQHATPI